MNSQRTILTVIIFLGLVALATVVGGFVLAYQGESIPAELIGLGGTALGAVGGILAKTGTDPIPIAVAPVEVAAAPPPQDFAVHQEKLTSAANQLLDVAQALGYQPLPDVTDQPALLESTATTPSEVPVQAG